MSQWRKAVTFAVMGLKGVVAAAAMTLISGCSSGANPEANPEANTADDRAPATAVATYEAVGAPQEITAAAETGSNRLVGADQLTDGSQVVVDLVELQGTSGYVVIYQEVNGAPAQPLGSSALLPEGAHGNVAVAFDPPLDPDGAHAKIFAMLHAETSGNATMEFPGPDAPIAEEGRIVTLQLALTAA